MGAFRQIGDVATETGLSPDTIRFYERERLLPRATRTGGGFRLFSPSDVTDLQFIRGAQELGFSLAEIRDLLALRNTEQPDCGRVEKMLEDKIASIRTKIAALSKLELDLKRRMIHCQANLRRPGQGHAKACPALTEITHARERKSR